MKNGHLETGGFFFGFIEILSPSDNLVEKLSSKNRRQTGGMNMPLHFIDRDISSEVSELSSVLIVPCNMCPAVTVAVREKKPFIQFFKHFLKSAPFEDYIRSLQSQLRDFGLVADVFRSSLYHQWFMCMWTARKRKKLGETAKRYDAVLVLGCESAIESVRDAVKSSKCKVIEGMEPTGIMNAQLSFQLPGDISFKNCKIVSTSKRSKDNTEIK